MGKNIKITDKPIQVLGLACSYESSSHDSYTIGETLLAMLVKENTYIDPGSIDKKILESQHGIRIENVTNKIKSNKEEITKVFVVDIEKALPLRLEWVSKDLYSSSGYVSGTRDFYISTALQKEHEIVVTQEHFSEFETKKRLINMIKTTT